VIQHETIQIKQRVRAIVMFGPPTDTSGFKAGEYYSVILDPNMLSPGGEYLRFEGAIQPGTEIQGWQRVAGLTVCEEGYTVDKNAVLKIRAIVKE
jgi:hypothetical protein